MSHNLCVLFDLVLWFKTDCSTFLVIYYTNMTQYLRFMEWPCPVMTDICQMDCYSYIWIANSYLLAFSVQAIKVNIVPIHTSFLASSSKTFAFLNSVEWKWEHAEFDLIQPYLILCDSVEDCTPIISCKVQLSGNWHQKNSAWFTSVSWSMNACVLGLLLSYLTEFHSGGAMHDHDKLSASFGFIIPHVVIEMAIQSSIFWEDNSTSLFTSRRVVNPR